MRNIAKQIFNILLRCSISVIILFFLFRSIDFGKIIQIVSVARIDYLVLSLFFLSFAYILGFLRWYLLLESIDMQIPIKRVAVSFAGGVFFNLFLPSTVGGDLVRVTDLASHARRIKEVTATVLIDRIVGFTALGLIALLAIFLGYSYVEGLGILTPVIILFVFIFSIIAVLFTKNIFAKLKFLIPVKSLRQKAENLHAEIFYFRNRPKVLLKTLGMSFLTQIFFIISIYFIFRGLHVDIKLIYPFMFIPLIAVVAMIPVSIGGLGLRDAGSVFFFTKVNIAKDAAIATSLLNFSFIALFGILCGIIYVFALHNRWLQRH